VPADADSVADRWPELTFSRRHRELVGARPRQPTDRLFDDLYGGADVAVHRVSGRARGATLEVDLGRWSRPADEVDQMVVARCEPPVLDIGCGPGRMVAALQRSGRAALGIDISAVAVAAGRRAGGQVLRRDLALPLAGEGRWGTALLLDGNIGIGGSPDALLRRLVGLLARGGAVLVELDPPGVGVVHERVRLEDGARASAWFAWARVGADAVEGPAYAAGLRVRARWEDGGRFFAELRAP
jgi:SAM-dependent methyltransferase